MMKPHLPTTETLAAATRQTDTMAQLNPADKHPMLMESERVLRLLYEGVAAYDRRYPGVLPHTIRSAVFALYDALLHHSLAEQSIRLEIASAEITACIAIAEHPYVVDALASVKRFLALPLPEQH